MEGKAVQLDLGKCLRVTLAVVLSLSFAIPQNLLAQTHIVSPAELQKQARSATQEREQNREKVQQFLSSDAARKAMQSSHIDAARVKTAVSSLSDSELAQLAARTDKAQRDFAAGTLNDRDLIIIILAVVALILIIVAVR